MTVVVVPYGEGSVGLLLHADEGTDDALVAADEAQILDSLRVA